MSARRAARAAGGSAPGRGAPTHADVATLLRSRDAEVWTNHEAFLALMTSQGWLPGCVGWMTDTHPANRRAAAAEAWARENAITRDGSPAVDRPALRRMGLAYDHPEREPR